MSQSNQANLAMHSADELGLPAEFNPDTFVTIDERFLLHPQAAEALVLMREEARMEGINIDIVSSFRSVAQQLVIWNAKWQGKRPLYSRESQQIDAATLSDTEKLHAILSFSALPGASRHHWGTDLDVYDKSAVTAAAHKLELVAEEYQHNGPCAVMAEWLTRNARIFGFEFPYREDRGGIAPEPWHISHQPTAHSAEQALSLDALQNLITSLNIEGKTIILENLEVIYHRYVINAGWN